MDKLPFFRSYKLSPWNIVTMSLYTILSLGMFYYYAFDDFPKQEYILLYGIGTHIFLCFFQYRALRNLSVFYFWLIIGIIHFFFYLYLKDLPEYFVTTGSSAKVLRNTIILLSLFQSLRYMSLKIQGQEFVMPPKNGGTDIYDGRKAGFIDFLCFALYMIALLLLIMF